MSTPTNPRREHPGTYLVPDRFNKQELSRLHIQDQMITTGMGGVLPEQPDPTIFRRVLDVGCGTGGWLIEAAKTYSTMSLLVGVDVNKRMVEYAQAEAAAQQISDRVEFRTMDALLMLEFPTGFFDLVNQRLGMSHLRTWDWRKLLDEFQRVTRPDGVTRVTELGTIESTSPALIRLCEILLDASYRAGHYFTPDWNGVTNELTRLLRQYGFLNVQTRPHTLEYRAGTIQGQRFYEDMRLGFRTWLPFLQKWSRVPKDYETIYQQMLSEMQQPDFVATVHYLTAWGNNPPRKEKAVSMAD